MAVIRKNFYQPSTYINFDGNTNSYISTGQNLIIPDSQLAVSFACWIKLAPLGTGSTDGIRVIIGNRYDTGQTGFNFKIANKAKNKIEHTFFDKTPSSQGEIGTTTVEEGEWTHVGVTFDGRTTIFYMNGCPDQKSTLVAEHALNATGSDNIRIGHRQRAGTTAEYFSGGMSDLCIWGRVVSAQEFKDMYNNVDKTPTTSLLARWKMDEGSGSTIADSSGNGYTGTFNSAGVTWGSQEINAIQTNGTTDYGTIADNDAWSYATANGLTISFWMRADSISMPSVEGTGYVEFLNKTGLNKNEWAFRMYQDGNSESRGNRISFYHFTNTGGLGAGSSFQDVVVSGEWIHITGVMDTQYIYIYKNGILREMADWTETGPIPITPTNTTSTIRIGAGGDNSDSLVSFFKGAMKSLRIWSRALSATEVMQNYQGIIPSSGLVGEWKMNEGSGNTLTGTGSVAVDGNMNSTSWTRKTNARATLSSQNPFKFGNKITNWLAGRKASTGNKVLTLDGSTQYASIADDSQTGLDFGTDDFMIGGWFRIHDVGTLQVLMCKYSGASFANSSGGIGWELLFRGDQATKGLQFRINDGQASGTTISFNRDTCYIADGEWHHIAVTVSRTENASIYIDGIQATSGSITANDGTVNSTGAFIIGRRGDGSANNHLNGDIQDLFVYDFGVGGIIDGKQVADILMSSIYLRNPITTNMVSCWSFNNNANDTKNVNNLTLTGSPTYSNDSNYSAGRTVSGTRTII